METHTKFAIFDSLALTVLNRASNGTAVKPMGFDNLALSPEVSLSTICTVAGSSGLEGWSQI